MIQVTYDEYNQCYTKHDTLSSLLEGKKIKKKSGKAAEGFHILINSSLLKSVRAREIFRIFSLLFCTQGAFSSHQTPPVLQEHQKKPSLNPD